MFNTNGINNTLSHLNEHLKKMHFLLHLYTIIQNIKDNLTIFVERPLANENVQNNYSKLFR